MPICFLSPFLSNFSFFNISSPTISSLSFCLFLLFLSLPPLISHYLFSSLSLPHLSSTFHSLYFFTFSLFPSPFLTLSVPFSLLLPFPDVQLAPKPSPSVCHLLTHLERSKQNKFFISGTKKNWSHPEPLSFFFLFSRPPDNRHFLIPALYCPNVMHFSFVWLSSLRHKSCFAFNANASFEKNKPAEWVSCTKQGKNPGWWRLEILLHLHVDNKRYVCSDSIFSKTMCHLSVRFGLLFHHARVLESIWTSGQQGRNCGRWWKWWRKLFFFSPKNDLFPFLCNSNTDEIIFSHCRYHHRLFICIRFDNVHSAVQANKYFWNCLAHLGIAQTL